MKKAILMSALMAINSLQAAPTADVAILLDTSGSMQGLINQVRDGLWQTLNSLGTLKKGDEKAQVRLALYEYGSGVVTQEANFIQLLSPLTTDHTKLAEALFKTQAKGGTEYSGMAIQMATNDLKWTMDASDFKAIVIAGNETINQGPVEPLLASAQAFDQDIIVNTVFAGPETHTIPNFGGGGFGGGFGNCQGFFCPNPPVQPTQPTQPTTPADPTPNPIFLEWREMANKGGGASLSIDHNQSLRHIPSPFDEDIVKLTESINETFLPFGKKGQSEFDRMIDLDRNIRGSGAGSYMDWGSYRGGSFGSATQADWDLVTLMIEDEAKALSTLEKLTDEELPESLRRKPLIVKVRLVREMVSKRQGIQAEITELREKRAAFVEEERRRLQGEGEKTFSEAIKEALVKQLTDKGFTLSEQ